MYKRILYIVIHAADARLTSMFREIEQEIEQLRQVRTCAEYVCLGVNCRACRYPPGPGYVVHE